MSPNSTYLPFKPSPLPTPPNDSLSVCLHETRNWFTSNVLESTVTNLRFLLAPLDLQDCGCRCKITK